MNWKVFAAIFVAELGDKTQIAALSFAATSDRPWQVFLAASAALVASSALGVLAGAWIGQRFDPVWTQRGAGVIFLALGAIMVVRSSS